MNHNYHKYKVLTMASFSHRFHSQITILCTCKHMYLFCIQLYYNGKLYSARNIIYVNWHRIWWLRHPRKVTRHHTAIGFIRLSVETAND